MPEIGKVPEVGLVIDDLKFWPGFRNVVTITIILVQNDVENQLLIDFLLDFFPFIRILVLFFNGFQSPGCGIGATSGLNIEGPLVVVQKEVHQIF